VVLKRITWTNEIKLLTYLHQISRPGNHTIPFTTVLSTPTDRVIYMPYKMPLSECSTLSVSIVVDFGQQLLEAVQFIHEQGVAHRDLKPENVVVDLGERELFIINYGLAMSVDGRDEMVHGYVGTDGFTAPEVGDDWKERYYSPIAADLWATGKVLEFLLYLSDHPKSPTLTRLLWISKWLLNDDPEKRLGADNALAYIR
jgi:serine/threonine protein kinase